MASENDIIGKADALLRRHSPAAPVGGETGAFPVLTDLIDAPAQQNAPAVPAEDLTQEVVTRVMAEVEGRIAAELEKRLARLVAAQVKVAVATAIADLRRELAGPIGDAIAEAHARRPVK